MTEFAFSNSPYSVRSDLSDAFRYTWDKLSRSGTWFTGAERVAIAGQVRSAADCTLCSERKQALSPFSVTGEHNTHIDVENDLSLTLVDIVHRMTTDISRLT